MASPSRSLALILLVCVTVAGWGLAAAQNPPRKPAAAQAVLPDSLGRLLVSRFALAQTDLASLRQGAPFVKVMDGADSAELIVVGVLRLDADRAKVAAGLRRVDIPAAAGPDEQWGRFGSPPAAGDLAAAILAPEVIAELSTCEPGDCIIKLPASDMARFRDRIDWNAPDAAKQANALFRGLLLQYLQAYQTGGGKALPRIDDKKIPVDLEDEFQTLLKASLLGSLDAGLAAYLGGYPRPLPDGTEAVFYWSRNRMGPRFVTELRHRCLREGVGPGDWSVAATRQIYANHFFRATLELAVVVPVNGGGCYLLRTDRARVDPLTGVAKLGRGKLKEMVRGGMVAELESIRAALAAAR